MQGISSLTEKLSAFQEVLCPVELVIQSVCYILIFLSSSWFLPLQIGV